MIDILLMAAEGQQLAMTGVPQVVPCKLAQVRLPPSRNLLYENADRIAKISGVPSILSKSHVGGVEQRTIRGRLLRGTIDCDAESVVVKHRASDECHDRGGGDDDETGQGRSPLRPTPKMLCWADFTGQCRPAIREPREVFGELVRRGIPSRGRFFQAFQTYGR